MHNPKPQFNNTHLQHPHNQAVTFDYDAFDNLIRSQGVNMIHYRAMRCPIGLSDKFDVRKTQDCHLDCNHGFLFTEGGEVTCLFTGNAKRENAQDYGFLQDANAQVSIPVRYDDCDEKISLARYDRFYLCEASITVQNWELVEAHGTGLDRLSFPVIAVIDLVDNRGVKYSEGAEFVIENGKIRWTSQNQPGQDITTGKGRVYTVRYNYRPFWYLKSFNHEIRVAQSEFLEGDLMVTTRHVRQLPYFVSMQREYFFQTESKDPEHIDTNNARTITTPPDGGFGSR